MLCLALLLLPLTSLAQSGAGPEVITLPAHGTVANLKPRALYRPDPEGTLSPDQLLSSDEGFQPYDPKWEDSAPPMWIKLKVKSEPASNGKYTLLVKRRFFQLLDIYLPSTGPRLHEVHSGVFNYEPPQTFGRYFVNNFQLAPSSQGVILIHLQTIQGSTGPLELNIQDELSFRAHQASSMWAYGLYFGAMLALIFYNFILYLNLRTPGHRLYVVTMACVIALMGFSAGLLQPYLPEALRAAGPIPNIFVAALVPASTSRFFQVFVNSKQYIPRLHNVITIFILVLLVSATVTCLVPLSFAPNIGLVVQVIGFLTLLLLVLSSILAAVRGSSSGYIFLAAWCAFAVGTFLWSLLSFDVIRQLPAAEYSLYIGSVLEAMILALGLTYRVGQLRTQRNIAIREQQKAARLANVDPLTGAYNRRFIENYLNGLLDSEDKRAFQGSLIMLDMDNFKPINDEFGHAAGDIVLQEMASRCLDTLRSEDVLARLGGDEFAIVLPDQSGNDAVAAAERIRHRISDRPAVCGMQLIPISVSVGVITSFAPGATAYSALKHADQALYEAKRMGRNQVIVYTGGEEPAPKPHQTRAT